MNKTVVVATRIPVTLADTAYELAGSLSEGKTVSFLLYHCLSAMVRLKKSELQALSAVPNSENLALSIVMSLNESELHSFLTKLEKTVGLPPSGGVNRQPPAQV